jgi:type IV fimbrial biogenesis protein FimT
MMSCSRQRAGGFTLVELMLVIALMAILATVMIPEMRGTYQHEKLRAAGRDLIRAVDLAYSQAVTRHQPHRLRVDNTGYQIERPTVDSGGQLEFSALQDLPGAMGKVDRRITMEVHEIEAQLEEGEEVQAEPISTEGRSDWKEGVEFYPDGTAQAKEIILRDSEGFMLSLRINPTTARAALVEMGKR